MAECMTPFCMTNKITGQLNSVPCGKCPACTARRASSWSFRLMQEDKRSVSTNFITLTYETSHVPLADSGYKTLDKRDLQLFFKRLRKDSLNRARTIKYFAVGEYGSKTYRPHYHIILYNADIASISPNWNKGHVHYGTLTPASIGYTLKYISKPSRIPLHKNDDRLPEFALMSKGLGDNYVNLQMVKWHKSDKDNRMYCPLPDGKKIAMPRYYKNKIYSDDERKVIGAKMRLKMLKELEEKEKNPMYYGDKFEAAKAAFERNKLLHGKNDKI